jgi:hypothetical protein
LGSIQGWQGEAREEGACIHVVLHHRIGQHDIPLFESWIGGAGHARKQQEIYAGRRAEQARCCSGGAHFAPIRSRRGLDGCHLPNFRDEW